MEETAITYLDIYCAVLKVLATISLVVWITDFLMATFRCVRTWFLPDSYPVEDHYSYDAVSINDFGWRGKEASLGEIVKKEVFEDPAATFTLCIVAALVWPISIVIGICILIKSFLQHRGIS